MGNSESKKIDSELEEQFKCIRKYYDQFYGEMTVIEHKQSKTQYAKVEKILPSHDPSLKKYIKQRTKATSLHLVNLHEHFSYDIDLCSGNQQHIFIMEYCTHTLYQQITNRQERQEFYSTDELLSLFESIIDTVMELRKKNQRYLMSNSSLMFTQDGLVKGIQQILSNKNEHWETQYVKEQQYEDLIKNTYISPQAFLYYCRKQFFKAKEISLSQSSLIFTLGMNFIECALLADISDIYEYQRKHFNSKKLMDISEQIFSTYGNYVYGLICRMIDEEIAVRPNLREVKELLRGGLKKYKKKEKLNLQKRVSITLQFPY